MKKLIICIDGLPYDLFTEENMPFLYNYAKQNYFARLKTLFAFTGLEYTFFTGETPDKSGIWMEFCKDFNSIFKSRLISLFSFNKKIRDYTAVLVQLLKRRTWLSSLHNIPKDKQKYFDTSVKQGLWKLDFFKKKSFVLYKWPFFITEKQSGLVFKYESDEQRLNKILNLKNKEVYYTQLMSIDKTIHKFGKNSQETKDALRNLDEILKKFIENKDMEIIIWSDHGFSDVKNYIDLEKLLPKRKDYIYFIAGTTTHFWFGNEEVKKEVLQVLSKIKEGKLLNNKLAQKYKIPLLRKYGDVIFFVNKGNYFFPNFYQKKQSERFVSMHGYPEDKELDGILVTNKKIPKTLKIENMIEVIK